MAIVNRFEKKPDFELEKMLLRSSRPYIGTIPEYEEIFQGPKPLEEVVTEAVEQTVKEAVKFGYGLAKKEAKERFEKRFQNYLGIISSLAEVIYEITESRPAIRIKEVRTNLDSATRRIDLFILIDYDRPEERVKFSKVISDIERTMLIKRNLIVEIFYAQADPERIDDIAIDHDYPFVYQQDKDAVR